MSTSVTVYSVPIARFCAIPASRDHDLLAALQPFDGFFKSIDALAADDDEAESAPTCAVAAAQIINGTPPNRGCGYVYGYAYEALCMAVGSEMDRTWPSISRSYEWFPEIDKALELLRVPLSVNDLLCRGALIDIPEPDDFPSLGWWTEEEIAHAAEGFKQLGNESLGEWTSDMAGTIEDIRSWIEAVQPGFWLVGVQY